MKICAAQAMMALIVCGVSAAHDNYAQWLDRKITLSVKEVPFEVALKKLESVSRVRMFYSIDQLDINEPVSIEANDETLRAVLDDLLSPHNINYKVNERKRALILKRQTDLEASSQTRPNELPSVSTMDFQPAIITGTVLDAITQQPMAGVNIILKGTPVGTTTDSDGKYSIEADEHDILVFSFIGYVTFETQVNGRSIIDISLQEDVRSLNEVVVNAGYWDVKEKEQTGNISRVTSEDISKQPVSNPLQTLQGRIPGLYIQQANGVPGSNLTIRIRGQNSIASGNEPLFIVDNVPFMAGNLSSTTTSASILGSSGVSPLNSINPADIESIEVLKDADATAIYGSRGANGVILITTKKGKSTGKPKVDVNIYSGISQVSGIFDMLDTKQYLAMRRQAFAMDGIAPALHNASDLLIWDTTRYTNWQKTLIGGKAKTTNAQLSLSGGNEGTQFSFNAGYEKQGTVFPGDLSMDKLSSRLSVSHISQNEKLTAMFSVLYTSNKSNLISQDFTYRSLTLPPNAPGLYKSDGTLNWENSTWENPMSELQVKYRNKINNLIANSNISYEIIKGLQASVSLGLNDMRLTDKKMLPSTYYDPAYAATAEYAELNLNNSSMQSWIVEPKLSYIRGIGMGQLSLFTGATFQQKLDEKLYQYGSGFPSDAVAEDIGSASRVLIIDYINTTYRYDAVFGRINYNYLGKYIVNITARRDGSSRFGPDKRFANFGAGGVAWIFSKEEFMKAVPIMSFGKLRASYGVTGNDQITDYGYLSTYRSTGAIYQNTVGISPTRLFNPDFAWEVNRKFEAGLEFGFIQDRLELDISYYRNRASNQLVNYPLAMTTGFNGVQANLNAVVENHGWEISLNSTNIKTQHIAWTTSLNFSLPRNILISFPMLETSSYANRYLIGQPLTISKKYHYLGVDPQTGLHQFEDMNKDGVITSEDQQYVSKIALNYHGGISNNFQFKGWQLDVMIQFVKQLGVNYWGSITTYPGYRINQPTQLLESKWTREGDEGKSVQRLTTGINGDAVTAFFTRYTNSDAVVTDASFIRLKSVSLSYTFPERWTPYITGRVFIQGQNLLTFTRYFGLDPENYNSTSLPPLRTLVAGIQLTF